MMRIGKLGQRKAPSGFASRSSPARYQKTYSSVDRKLERAKTYATIFSAIAIPVVLTISGYFIQRQLASEGLRKDYVGIATAILKEKPEGQ